jgi:hypothetical protein
MIGAGQIQTIHDHDRSTVPFCVPFCGKAVVIMMIGAVTGI